jgi:hypothetical protein
MTLPGLVLALMAGALFERILRRGRPMRSRATAAAGFDVLGAAFDPGQRHRVAEKESKQLQRDDVEDGAPPRSLVDLSAGTAHLHVPRNK